MSTKYPSAIDDNVSLPDHIAGDPVPSDEWNTQNAAIKAVETKLGLGLSNASSATTGKVLKKQADGTTTWDTDKDTTDHTLLSNIGTNTHPQIDNHIASTANPHSVTKAQVGLGNVPNIDATQRANHTGTQLASTISDFQTQVSANSDVAANTADRHPASQLGTKTLDETNIADGKVIEYNATSGNLEYVTPAAGGASAAADVTYDNTTSGLAAINVQGAIDELKTDIAAGGGGDVSGPASATTGDIATFSGASGKLIQDSGKTLPTGSVVGNSDTQVITNKDLTSGTNTFPTFNQNTTGNAATATKLATARNIDGQAFDGTANITVIAPGTHAAISKPTPVDADELSLVDSAATFSLKKLTWSNLKATLKTYFDTLYTNFTASDADARIAAASVDDLADVDTSTTAPTDTQVLAWNATASQWKPATASGGLSNVVDDTTPQLGGNLDLNSHTVGNATAADLTKLHGLTATTTELNYTDGVTSAIQTQLDGKPDAATTNFSTQDLKHGYSLTKRGVVIAPGGSGTWNEALVESPNVFFDPRQGKYVMVFTGYALVGGVPQTGALGYATSTDLETWTPYASNPFFTKTGNEADPDSHGVTGSFVWYEDGVYHLFYIGLTLDSYEGGTQRLCYATSTDFSTWTRHGAIISPSGSGWRSTAVWHPNIVKRGTRYYLFFNASDSTPTETIGYAYNDTLGPTGWVVDDVNSPLLTAGTAGSWDDNHVGDPFVYRIGDTWYMAFYGVNSTNAADGLAYTSDANFPLGWQKYSGNPVLSHGAAGSIDASHAHKPSIWISGSAYYHWYTAVDDSSPQVRQIALASELTSVSTTLDGLSDVTITTPSNGQVLTYDSATQLWENQNAASGFANPMTTSGDIIYGGASGVATRLAKGTDGQVLTLASGVPSWADPSGSSSSWIASISDNCGSASQFLNNVATDGTGAVTPAFSSTYNGIVVDTSANSGCASMCTINPKTNYYSSWNNGKSWNQYWEVADITTGSANGDLFFGAMSYSLFFGSAVNYLNAHIGVRRTWTSTVVTYLSTADGSTQTNTAVTLTNSTQANFISIQKTASSVKYFDCISGTLLATITTSIPTQSTTGFATFAATNTGHANQIKGICYGFTMARNATF